MCLDWEHDANHEQVSTLDDQNGMNSLELSTPDHKEDEA